MGDIVKLERCFPIELTEYAIATEICVDPAFEFWERMT